MDDAGEVDKMKMKEMYVKVVMTSTRCLPMLTYIWLFAPPDLPDKDRAKVDTEDIKRGSREDKYRALYKLGSKIFRTLQPRNRLPATFRPIIDDCVRWLRDENRAFEPGKMSRVFKILEIYVWNLIDQPWRPEFRTILTYSGIYKTQIEANFPYKTVELFTVIGYQLSGDSVLHLPEVPPLEDCLQWAFECYMVSIELDQQQILVHSLQGCANVFDVYDQRKTLTGNLDDCKAKLITDNLKNVKTESSGQLHSKNLDNSLVTSGNAKPSVSLINDPNRSPISWGSESSQSELIKKINATNIPVIVDEHNVSTSSGPDAESVIYAKIKDDTSAGDSYCQRLNDKYSRASDFSKNHFGESSLNPRDIIRISSSSCGANSMDSVRIGIQNTKIEYDDNYSTLQSEVKAFPLKRELDVPKNRGDYVQFIKDAERGLSKFGTDCADSSKPGAITRPTAAIVKPKTEPLSVSRVLVEKKRGPNTEPIAERSVFQSRILGDYEQWQCYKCTLANDPHESACIACLTPRRRPV